MKFGIVEFIFQVVYEVMEVVLVFFFFFGL